MEKPYLRIKMPDMSIWGVPLKFIASNRAAYYEKDDPFTTFEEEMNFAMKDEYVCIDWAANELIRPWITMRV